MTVDSGSIYLVEDGNQRTYENTDVGFTFTQPHLPGFMTAIEFLRFLWMSIGERIKQSLSPEEFLMSVGISSEEQHRLMKDYSPWHEKQSTNAAFFDGAATNHVV